MKTRPIALTIVLLALTFTTVFATEKPDLNGTWLMDKTRSEGLPKEMEQKMRVTQEGDKLDLETDLFQGDDVTTVHDGYQLNGQAVDFPARLQSGQTTTGKRTAKWNTDGTGFVVKEAATFDTPEGKVSITMERKWTLSADGKTLIIELHHTGPNGPISTKRTFQRK
ncbi:MAG: hypothetical protein JNM09_09740 [Blastocatellia bacterium]|nr:hypothetical protein [Blastocatellia bacterium]